MGVNTRYAVNAYFPFGPDIYTYGSPSRDAIGYKQPDTTQPGLINRGRTIGGFFGCQDGVSTG